MMFRAARKLAHAPPLCGSQRLEHGRARLALENVLLELEVPKSQQGPLIAGVPLRHTEDRIQADARESDAFVEKLLGHVRQIVKPWPARLRERARLRDHDL